MDIKMSSAPNSPITKFTEGDDIAIFESAFIA